MPSSSTLLQKDTKLPPLQIPIKFPEKQSTLSLADPRLEHMEEVHTQEEVEVEVLTSEVVVVSPTAAEVRELPEDEVQDNLRTHESPSQSKP